MPGFLSTQSRGFQSEAFLVANLHRSDGQLRVFGWLLPEAVPAL